MNHNFLPLRFYSVYDHYNDCYCYAYTSDFDSSKIHSFDAFEVTPREFFSNASLDAISSFFHYA